MPDTLEETAKKKQLLEEIWELEHTPNPLDDDFHVARVIISQIGMSVKMGLSLRQFVIVPAGLLATIGPKGTTIRVQITLNRGQDLYEVKVGRQNRTTKQLTWAYEQDGIFCDQLTEVIYHGFEQVHGA